MIAAAPRQAIAALSLAGVCAALALTTLLYLATGAEPQSWTLRLGPLPGGLLFALDGVSGFFLLPVLIVGAAAAAASTTSAVASTALLAAFVGGMALCVSAGDALTLLGGFELMSAASLVLVLTGDAAPASRQAAVLYAGMAAFSALCLIAVMALLSSDGLGFGGLGFGGLGFAAIRSHPPRGVIAALVFGLTLLGAGAKAGLVPLHVWLPLAHAAAPAHVSALLSGAMTKVALYVLVRVLFDLCGPVQPPAWGSLLMLVGAATAVLGAARANFETDIKSLLGCSTIENMGLIAVALGLALAARAADLPALASLAMSGALLHVLAHGLFKSLLFLAAGAVQHEAGSRVLDRLGGLIHRMPVTTACVLVGAASLATLPLSAGFASAWLVLQSVLAAPRIGGLPFQIVVGGVAAALALAAALAAAAAVRLVGVAFLGRPRTPRGAAAEEAPPAVRRVLVGLTTAIGLLGVLPWLGVALLEPALRTLLGADMAARATWLGLRTQPDGAGYSPPAMALVLAGAGALMVGVARRAGRGGVRRAPAWDGGFGSPPRWLPFGDPQAQSSAAGQSQLLRHTVGRVLLRAEERVTPAAIAWSATDPSERAVFAPLALARDRLSGWAERLQVLTARQALIVLFVVLVATLAAVAVTEQM